MKPNPNVIGTVALILFIMLFFIFRSMTKKTPEAHFSVAEFLIKGLYHIAAFLQILAEASDSFLICFRENYKTTYIRSRAEDVRKSAHYKQVVDKTCF